MSGYSSSAKSMYCPDIVLHLLGKAMAYQLSPFSFVQAQAQAAVTQIHPTAKGFPPHLGLCWIPECWTTARQMTVHRMAVHWTTVDLGLAGCRLTQLRGRVAARSLSLGQPIDRSLVWHQGALHRLHLAYQLEQQHGVYVSTRCWRSLRWRKTSSALLRSLPHL